MNSPSLRPLAALVLAAAAHAQPLPLPMPMPGHGPAAGPSPARGPGPGAGHSDYLHSCASCHGTLARGDGPLARHLLTPPSDLTQLARRNGGVFPSERVAAVIDGRNTPSIGPHGTREMPVWGQTFAEAAQQVSGNTGLAEAVTRRRIDDVVRFLERQQQ